MAWVICIRCVHRAPTAVDVMHGVLVERADARQCQKRRVQRTLGAVAGGTQSAVGSGSDTRRCPA
jgi:hypothetical protein